MQAAEASLKLDHLEIIVFLSQYVILVECEAPELEDLCALALCHLCTDVAVQRSVFLLSESLDPHFAYDLASQVLQVDVRSISLETSVSCISSQVFEIICLHLS